MGSPPVKRALSPDADEFDDFDTSADDLIRAVEESEGVKKTRLSSPPKAVSRPSPPGKAPTASLKEAPPVYNHPYSGTKEDPLLLERSTMGKAWFDRLEPAMRQDSFARLKAFLDAEKRAGKTIYPPANLIHSWSRTTPLEKVKVVIVGQDPYHQPGQACGHSFSVPVGKAVPASLQNIYKELKAEFPDFQRPSHGGPLASMFANQSHAGTDSGPSKGVVFLAWGLPAAKTLAEAGVTEKTPNVLLLRSPHPSPLSAHRGFLGNGHFAKANEWLEDPTRHGKGGGIRWGDL
ncbi:uracil-DNA glycosylase [Malassezia equina]|uniref:Uracil-DNA glycosylase n=1 Tax=Malassezia equina TaxID=1381935 RepID=A0AAF0EBZ7_9BASI|nr:uracil-DNA glycosylase [Malassezia equina]